QTHLQALAETDEGIARQPLAAFHAFQQKARPERLELEIGRHWRVQIGGNVERSLHGVLGPAVSADRRRKKTHLRQITEMGFSLCCWVVLLAKSRLHPAAGRGPLL